MLERMDMIGSHELYECVNLQPTNAHLELDLRFKMRERAAGGDGRGESTRARIGAHRIRSPLRLKMIAPPSPIMSAALAAGGRLRHERFTEDTRASAIEHERFIEPGRREDIIALCLRDGSATSCPSL